MAKVHAADLHSRVGWSQEPQVSWGRECLYGQLALNTLNRVFRDMHVIRLGAASRRGPDDTGRYIDDTLVWSHGKRCRDRWRTSASSPSACRVVPSGAGPPCRDCPECGERVRIGTAPTD